MNKFKVPSSKNFIFSTMLDVRIYDLNYGNHLGHDSLVSLIHECRVRFLKKLGYSELNIHGFGILVTNLVINYMKEAFYDDRILINLAMGDISKTSLELIYQVNAYDLQKEIAKALTTVTFYDYSAKKPAKIPPAFLRSLETHKPSVYAP